MLAPVLFINMPPAASHGRKDRKRNRNEQRPSNLFVNSMTPILKLLFEQTIHFHLELSFAMILNIQFVIFCQLQLLTSNPQIPKGPNIYLVLVTSQNTKIQNIIKIPWDRCTLFPLTGFRNAENSKDTHTKGDLSPFLHSFMCLLWIIQSLKPNTVSNMGTPEHTQLHYQCA